MADTDYISYGVLAGNQVIANSGTTTVLGDVGSYLSIGGVGTVIATNQTNIGSLIDDALINAQNDYTSLSSITPSNTVTAADIGGMTFNPGVTEFTNAGGITIGTVMGNNTITLDGSGAYIFQVINGDLVTDATLASVSVILINGAKPTQIYWLVNGSVDLQSSGGNTTDFYGTILCQANITLGTDSTNVGSLCASNSGDITLNNNNIISTLVQRPRDIHTTNYINIESTLADNEAITINASNVAGGILINSGYGGITVDSTNTISLNAGAASNFTTSTGNLILESTTGLVNIDGGSGINIGNNSTSTPINIGTSSNAKTITIGNSTGATSIDLNTGTGGANINTASGGAISLNAIGASSNFTLASTANGQDLTFAITGTNAARIVLSSTGTGSDSIFFNTSAGGLTANVAGEINLVANSTSGAAINLDTTTNNGGITILSGNQGIVVNTVGGTIGIGNFNASTILLGTVGPNSITVGNTSTNTILFERFGTAGFIHHQEPETALSDADATLTIGELLTVLFTISPSTARTLTLPTAADIVTGISGVAVNDSIDFDIINTGSDNVIIAAGTNGTLIGNDTIIFGTSGLYRLRITNISGGTEAYTVYRLN